MLRLLSLLASLSVAIVLIGATYLYERSLVRNSEDLAAKASVTDINRLAGRLEQALNHHLNLTRSLAAFVRSKPDLGAEEFDAFASELVRDEVGIRSLQLAPDGIVTYVTNKQQNAAAIGYDLLGDPSQRDRVLNAIDSREFVIVGPIDLVQGGKAVIARQPIYVRAPNGGDTFWGFATVLLDPIELLRDAGVADGLPGLRLAVRGKDGLGKEGETFFGDPKVFDDPAVEVPVTLAVGSWALGAAWTQNALLEFEKPRIVVWVGGTAGASIAALLVFYLLTRPEQLRRQVERATEVSRLSEARFADFANAASDWLWEISRDYRITYVSDKVEEIIGIPASAQVGLSLSELFGADYFTDKWAEARNGIKERKIVRNFTYTRRREDGQIQYLMVSGVPFFDKNGRFSGYRGTGSDITNQKLAFERAQLAELRLRTAIESLEDGFVLYDAEDRLSICNERYREIYAKSADLIEPGRSFEEIARAGAERGQYPEAVGRVEEWVAERMQAHLAANTAIEQQLPNGRWMRVAERRTPDGGIVGFRVDITALKEAQEAAVAASKAKSQFLANMSHEIRTPLNAIIGLSGMTLKTEMTGQQREYIQMVESSSKTLLGIVDDILDFSKIEAGHMELDVVELDLSQVMKDLSLIMVGRAAGKPIELIIDTPPSFPSDLRGDPFRLGQVLNNLVANAIKFTDQGEVVVSAEVTRYDPDVAEIRFEIRDTGIGITEQQADILFEPFTQADVSTTRKFGGTGLGLSISRQLVQLMGGSIGAFGSEGDGSTFWFKVLVDRFKSPMRMREDLLRTEVLADKSILVVVPNDTLQQSLRKLLRPLCTKVTCVSTAKEAVAAVMRAALQTGQSPYQFVILDQGVDGVIGGNSLRKIGAAMNSGCQPHVFLLARHGVERSEIDSGSLGPVEILSKPVIPSDLLERLVRSLSGEDGRDDRMVTDGQASDGPGALAAEQHVKGMKVLMVEDNAINRRITMDVLERYEIIVDVAENGRIGAEKALGGDYDAVLMDLQMPEMDGFEATAEIRKDPSKASLPIIALTAHAMASARDNSLNAGMNDLITKPIEPEVLLRTLAKWVGQKKSSATAQQSVSTNLEQSRAVATKTSVLLNGFPGVDAAGLLRLTGGSESAALDLLREFCEQYALEADRIHEHWSAGSFNDAANLAHALKGVSGNLRALGVQGVADELEQRLKENGNSTKIAALIDDLSSALAAVGAAVSAKD